MTPQELIDYALEGLAIVLSVVSLIISVVAFFASHKFYRDGVQLQQSANDALTKISEKTDYIQTQVGGMFDKTLDAAIGKREILADQFEELNEQLEKSKTKLIEESISQIGAAGEKERSRLTSLVDDQIALLREKVDNTRESAQEMVDEPIPSPSYLSNIVYALLMANPEGLTVVEIHDKILLEWKIAMPLTYLRRRLKNMVARGDIIATEDGKFVRR